LEAIPFPVIMCETLYHIKYIKWNLIFCFVNILKRDLSVEIHTRVPPWRVIEAE
jgi:hypothetical protein